MDRGHADLLDARVRCLSARDGRSELTIAMTPRIAYAPGSGFPASVVASLIDYAGGAATAAAVGTTRLATLNCHTQLMAPADGTLLSVDARMVRVAGRRVLCFAEAHADDDNHSSAARMVLMGRRDEPSRPAPGGPVP